MMFFLDERDLVGLGRDARDWLVQDREMARRGREAREWLTQDERGRVIGLVLFSVALSIALSLMATAIVGFVSRRRTGPQVDGEMPDAPGDAAAEGSAGEPVGIPVVDGDAAPAETEVHVEA